MTNHNINIIYDDPKIFRIGETKINVRELEKFRDFVAEESDQEPTKLNGIIEDVYETEHHADIVAELCGRICYQSYYTGREREEYILNILEQAHGSVTEHASFNYIVAGISRSATHQLIRHRVGMGVSEMSQRFVGGNEKSGQWNFVAPVVYAEAYRKDPEKIDAMLRDVAAREIDVYLERQEDLRNILKERYEGFKLTKTVNEAAREFLPSWVETRIVVSPNVRTLRHILNKRGSLHADAQIRRLAVCLAENILRDQYHLFKDVVFEGEDEYQTIVSMKYEDI